MNILFVCGRNKRRSRTAEKIFRNDHRFHVKSAGFSESSPVKISEKLIFWSDLIFVMEYKHSKRIGELYRNSLIPKVHVLNIPDIYDFMDEKLIFLLNKSVDKFFSEE